MFNKNRVIMLFGSIMALAIAAFTISQVFAQGGGATVIRVEGVCTVENLDHEIVPVQNYRDKQGGLVFTNNKNGNWSAACSGWMPEGSELPDKAVVWEYEDVGGYCGSEAGGFVTLDFHQVIQPSGRVKLSCHFPESPSFQTVSSFGIIP